MGEPSSFFERVDELAEEVGDGHLIGQVEVNQVYAHRQHEEMTWVHPHGGGPKYLERPWLEGAEATARRLADSLLGSFGPTKGMIESVEAGARGVFENAPVEFEELRNSAHPSVVDGGHVVERKGGWVDLDVEGGHVVYDRPPAVHRLSEEELKLRHRDAPGR